VAVNIFGLAVTRLTGPAGQAALPIESRQTCTGQNGIETLASFFPKHGGMALTVTD
jgi:hypothetical protein